MKKIGVIIFADDSHVYLYDDIEISTYLYNPNDKKYKSLFDFVGTTFASLNNQLVSIYNGQKNYFINTGKILYIKEYPTKEQTLYSFD